MKNPIENFESVSDLLNIFSIIPDGTDETLDLNGCLVHVSKKDGSVKIKVESSSTPKPSETFDDSSIKKSIAEFKDNLNKLDDCTFVKSLEAINAAIDVKRFDELLRLDKFTKSEAIEVESMIDYFSQVISNNIREKINELEDLFDRF